MSTPKSAPKTVLVRFRGPAHVLEIGTLRLERNGEPVDIPAGVYRRLSKQPRMRLEIVHARKGASTEPAPDAGDEKAG
jgi:hypothetical protein